MVSDKEAAQKAHQLVDSLAKEADKPDAINKVIQDIYQCPAEVQKKVAAELVSNKNNPNLAKAFDEIVELVVTSNFDNIDKVGAKGNTSHIDGRISQEDVRAFVASDDRQAKIFKEVFDVELLKGLDYNPRDDRSHSALTNLMDGNTMTRAQTSDIAEKRQEGRHRAQERHEENVRHAKELQEHASQEGLSKRQALSKHSRELTEQRKEMVDLEKLLGKTNLSQFVSKLDANEDNETSRQDIERTLDYDKMARKAGNKTLLSEEETKAAEGVLKHFDEMRGHSFDLISEDSIMQGINAKLVAGVTDRTGDLVNTIDGRDGHSRLFRYDNDGDVVEIYHAHSDERWVFNPQTFKWDITRNGKTTSVDMDVNVDKDGEVQWTFNDGPNKGLTRKITAQGRYEPDPREKH